MKKCHSKFLQEKDISIGRSLPKEVHRKCVKTDVKLAYSKSHSQINPLKLTLEREILFNQNYS